MPIYSKDWRDPGDKWIKTNGGWEKEKVAGYLTFQDSLEDPEPDGPDPLSLLTRRGSRGELVPQPYCRIYTRNTKEVSGFNGLGETLMKLDFINAVRDIRRFRYICKLLDLLITQKLSTLSGGAQKMLFGMLEEVAREVTRSQQNVHLLHHLLQELRKRLEDYLWGNKLGSTILWEKHSRKFRDIDAIATTIEIREPGDDIHPKLQEVPEECVREILKKLDNHKDIRSAGEAYSVMAKVSKEKSIWRQLCRFHWSPAQIEYVIHLHRELRVQKNWHQVYDRLRRTYGLREEYPEKLCLCRNCSCMFWESYGHPCRNDLDSAAPTDDEQQQQQQQQEEQQQEEQQQQQQEEQEQQLVESMCSPGSKEEGRTDTGQRKEGRTDTGYGTLRRKEGQTRDRGREEGQIQDTGHRGRTDTGHWILRRKEGHGTLRRKEGQTST